MRGKKSFIFIIISILLLTVSACSSKDANSSTKGEKKTSGGELKVTLSAQPPTLDTVATNSVDTASVARNIFETLVAPNANYQPVPMLAESVDKSTDGKTYTFHLRKGVKFHNGNEMTSDDVVASMNRWKDLSSAAQSVIPNAVFKGSDKYTVTMDLPEPSSGVLNILASTKQFPAIMPKEIAEKAKPEGVTEYIGTGPFKFIEEKQNQFIHLGKFKDYKPVDSESSGLAGKKEALVDDLYFDIVKDASTRLAAIQTGEYDIVSDVPFEQYKTVKDNSKVKTSLDPYGNLVAIYNKKSKLFSDKNMRQAVNAAINEKDIMMATFANKELFKLDHGYMNKDQKDWYSENGKESYNQADAAKAKKLLAGAGYNGQEVKLIVTKDYSELYNSAVVLQGQLHDIGMNVKLETYDWPTLLEKRKDPGAWDILVSGYSTVTTPAQILYLTPNDHGWTEDPKIADLLSKINKSPSNDQAKKLWADLQEYAWNDYMPATNFGTYSLVAAATDKVKGFTMFQGPVVWNTKAE